MTTCTLTCFFSAIPLWAAPAKISLGPLYFSSALSPLLFIPASISVSPSPRAAAFPDEDGVSIHIHYGHFAPERDGRGDVGWKLGRGREGEMEDVIPH